MILHTLSVAHGVYLYNIYIDKTIRLWNLKDFTSKMLFQGHGKDVLSVGFSSDNRMIVSAGRDRTIRMWNTLGVLKWTIDSAHDDWVSQVLFSKDKNTYIISAGWDKKIKIWDQNMNMKTSLAGNTRAINAIAISPNGQFLASGGREGVVRIMNLHNNTLTRSFDCKSSVNAISFSPSHYVCVAATDAGLHVLHILIYIYIIYIHYIYRCMTSRITLCQQ